MIARTPQSLAFKRSAPNPPRNLPAKAANASAIPGKAGTCLTFHISVAKNPTREREKITKSNAKRIPKERLEKQFLVSDKHESFS